MSLDDFLHALATLKENDVGIVGLSGAARCCNRVVVYLVSIIHGAGIGGIVELMVVAGEVLHLAVSSARSLHHDG